MRQRRGSSLIETALFMPLMVSLLYGMVELARVSYTYFTLHKMLYTLARDVGTQSQIDFCAGDLTFESSKNFALRGGIEDAGESIMPGLATDQIAVAFQRRDSTSGELIDYTPDCGTSSAGSGPDYILVSLPDGYPIRLSFPGLQLDPIPLRPQVRIPFGGGS